MKVRALIVTASTMLLLGVIVPVAEARTAGASAGKTHPQHSRPDRLASEYLGGGRPHGGMRRPDPGDMEKVSPAGVSHLTVDSSGPNLPAVRSPR